MKRFGLPEHEAGADDWIMSSAYKDAMQEINRGRSSFCFGGVGVGSWPDHPDLVTVKDWLKKRDAKSDELEVVYWLAKHVRNEWAHLPQRTPSDHRELYAKIQRLCSELDAALYDTGSYYFRGGGHGLMGASVLQLLTDAESTELKEALIDSDGIDILTMNWTIPHMDELLRRLGLAAKRLHDVGPLHSQPNKRGAERGYFVRRMADIFLRRYGEVSAEVLAAITSVALGEATDRELVAKLLK